MARKKKEQPVVVETPTPKKSKKKKPDYEKDDGPLTESQLEQLTLKPVVQFEIDWDKIARDVKEAAEMVKVSAPVTADKPKRGRKVKDQTS